MLNNLKFLKLTRREPWQPLWKIITDKIRSDGTNLNDFLQQFGLDGCLDPSEPADGPHHPCCCILLQCYWRWCYCSELQNEEVQVDLNVITNCKRWFNLHENMLKVFLWFQLSETFFALCFVWFVCLCILIKTFLHFIMVCH